MKSLFSLVLLISCTIHGYGQQNQSSNTGFNFGVQYNYEFVFDGYIRVREWDVKGDRLRLKDLGMDAYQVINFHVGRSLKRNRHLTLSYSRYFIRGRSFFDKDIAYNGTLINARNGIDVSPTRYYRLEFRYLGNLSSFGRLNMQYAVGMAYDHITFYLDGEVSAQSLRDEVYEQFGRQAFPYPVIGIKGSYQTGEFSYLNLNISGTYIPEFKSFYTEGGPVHLQYNNFQAGISFERHVRQLMFQIGGKSGYMHLFQKSREDTNVISTFSGGPYFKLIYNL